MWRALGRETQRFTFSCIFSGKDIDRNLPLYIIIKLFTGKTGKSVDVDGLQS